MGGHLEDEPKKDGSAKETGGKADKRSCTAEKRGLTVKEMGGKAA